MRDPVYALILITFSISLYGYLDVIGREDEIYSLGISPSLSLSRTTTNHRSTHVSVTNATKGTSPLYQANVTSTQTVIKQVLSYPSFSLNQPPTSSLKLPFDCYDCVIVVILYL